MFSEAVRPSGMPQLVALLYANQSLAELSDSVAGSAHSGDSGLTTLLQAKVLYDAGSDEKATDLLANLIDGGTRQSRVKLWAAQALRDRGLMPGGPGAVEAQGIVMEVPVTGGRDVLAVYRDDSARFVSYSGAIAAYDANQPAVTELCRKIVAGADRIVAASKGFALPADVPKVTVLTLSGPIVAGSESPTGDVLRLGATLVATLAKAHAGA